jgi:hypothetical protein
MRTVSSSGCAGESDLANLHVFCIGPISRAMKRFSLSAACIVVASCAAGTDPENSGSSRGTPTQTDTLERQKSRVEDSVRIAQLLEATRRGDSIISDLQRKLRSGGGVEPDTPDSIPRITDATPSVEIAIASIVASAASATSLSDSERWGGTLAASFPLQRSTLVVFVPDWQLCVLEPPSRQRPTGAP